MSVSRAGGGRRSTGIRTGLIAVLVFTLSQAAVACGSDKKSDDASEGPDPLAKGQFGLKQIAGKNPLERIRRDPEEVTIAIVDSGIALNHPDLRPRLWHNPEEVPGPDPAGPYPPQGPVPEGASGWDAIGTPAPPSIAPDSDPQDPISHGTPVASIAAAATDNGVGMAGVAPNAELMAIRTCWEPGLSCYDELTGAAMGWAADNGARVLNLSMVAQYGHAEIDAAIASHPGSLFVAAAGNGPFNLDRPGPDLFPCETPRDNVICVAATDRSRGLASCSNFGAAAVDVAAPGQGLTTAAAAGGYAKNQPCGTSQATPHVSGLAALLFGAVPDASPADVKRAILDGVTPVPGLTGKTATGGVINVKRSLKLLQNRFKIPQAPKTSISAARTQRHRAIVELESNRNRGFECALDGRQFRPCKSTTTLGGLKTGRHVFEARALGRRRTVDPTPARRVLRIRA